MKYIRTKDNIYEQGKVFIIKENDVELVLPCINEDFIERTRGKSLNYRTNVIVKKTNAIEELCDCFVYGKCDYMELEEAQQEKEFYEQDLQKGEQPIYGAIWTDKGLIYVAKMNEKGELELL